MKDLFEFYVKTKTNTLCIKHSFRNMSFHVNQSEQVTDDADDCNERCLGMLKRLGCQKINHQNYSTF